MAARPGSAQSIRPDSSMSSRGPSIPPVVVKKTRAPAQPRAAADPAKTRVRRKSPLNNSGSAKASEPPSRSGSVALLNPPGGSQESQNSDMDSLTSGMKKINLSLITKEQKEARERAKTAAKTAPTKPATRIIPKPKIPKPPRMEGGPVQPEQERPMTSTVQAPTVPEIPDSQGPESFPSMPSTPQQLPPQIPTHLQQAAQVPLPSSSPVQFAQSEPAIQSAIQSGPIAFAQPEPTIHPTSNASSSDVFIPYQPEGPPPNPAPQLQEPIRWLPPNVTSTPTPMKRGDLPVFTATSAIPFGINSSIAPQAPKLQGSAAESAKPFDPSIWEVPETPKK